jgi:hypothetical protein
MGQSNSSRRTLRERAKNLSAPVLAVLKKTAMRPAAQAALLEFKGNGARRLK